MSELRRSGPSTGRQGRSVWLGRLFLLFLAVTTLLTAAFLLYDRLGEARRGARVLVEGGDPDLSTSERLYLQAYLSMRAEELEAPLAPGRGVISFVIAPGETANAIAGNLVEAGLLEESALFLNYLRYYGLDSELEAGTFQLDPQANIPALAQRLSKAYGDEVTLRFLEGWRHEEMAAYLAATRPAQIDPEAFAAIVQRRQPFDLSRYPFLDGLPPEASLEGFLFPDTYAVALDADAAELVDMMLRTFERRVTPVMRQAFAAHGLNLREAVTLASIVERETPLARERSMVAGVFYNRLAQGMRLQADPTVQYAVGYDAATNSWWKSPLTQADLDIDSPYNSYLNDGLPPGPIANPSLASLEAVAVPAATNNLYFVADCNGESSHLFSETYAEHLANVERCR